MNNVLKKLKLLPSDPGIYYFKNKQKKIIYIGKAANLRNRVNSYFYHNSSANNKLDKMIPEIDDLVWRTTVSEVEALIEEPKEIKKNQPFYNILMKDDKKYFYIVLSQDVFPRLSIIHQPSIGQTSLGPFTNGLALKKTLNALRKIIPFCACKNYHKKLCLSNQLGLCPGYCCLKNFKQHSKNKSMIKEYRHNLEKIEAILLGKSEKVLISLKKDMEKSAKEEKFEDAQKIKKQLEALKNILSHKKIVVKEKKKLLLPLLNIVKFKEIAKIKTTPRRIEAYDVSNLKGNMATGAMIVFESFQQKEKMFFIPQKKEYRIFHIQVKQKGDDLAMFQEIVNRRINHLPKQKSKTKRTTTKDIWRTPQIILMDGGKNQLNVAFKQFRRLKAPFDTISLMALVKKKEKLYTISQSQKSTNSIIELPKSKDFAEINRDLKVESYFLNQLPQDIVNLLKAMRDEAHRFAIKHHRILRQKEDLIS